MNTLLNSISLIQLTFYLFATLGVVSAVMVVVARNSVRAALFLVLAFVSSAGVWILLHAEFLALILVLVYVGAVMTLFLFVVMMLNLDIEPGREKFVRYLPLSALILLIITGLIVLLIGPNQFGLSQAPAPALQPETYSNTAALGSVLYTVYAYPFEVAGVMLLSAIIAAISLTHRPPHERKSQIEAQQIAVRAEDRVRLIKMKAEKKKRPDKISDVGPLT